MIPNRNLELPADIIARQMLGAKLHILSPKGEEKSGIITETEAYIGPQDKACHAYKGRTKRTEIMFGKPDHWYVYLCYGIHWMLNLVVGEEGYPAAVLIRGITPWIGPGRVTKNLGISGDFNGKPLTKKAGMWIKWNEELKTEEIEITPRVGIDYAGEEWANAPLRFIHKELWKDLRK